MNRIIVALGPRLSTFRWTAASAPTRGTTCGFTYQSVRFITMQCKAHPTELDVQQTFLGGPEPKPEPEPDRELEPEP